MFRPRLGYLLAIGVIWAGCFWLRNPERLSGSGRYAPVESTSPQVKRILGKLIPFLFIGIGTSMIAKTLMWDQRTARAWFVFSVGITGGRSNVIEIWGARVSELIIGLDIESQTKFAKGELQLEVWGASADKSIPQYLDFKERGGAYYFACELPEKETFKLSLQVVCRASSDSTDGFVSVLPESSKEFIVEHKVVA